MLDVVSLLPHAKKDSKVESKQSNGATLNELVELSSCSSCLFFEVYLSLCFLPWRWCETMPLCVKVATTLFKFSPAKPI
jgi:hypothetical protein